MFTHERLDVYKCSIRFVAQALKVIGSMPQGQGALVDQLRRASVSIPLNIAEGSGRMSSADQNISLPSHAGRPWNARQSLM